MQNKIAISIILIASLVLLFLSCSSNKKNNKQWEMQNYITVELTDIDDELAALGEIEFNKICTACHRFDNKLIGPPLAGVTNRRSPNYIMNLLLHNKDMVKHNPEARALFEEYKKIAMVVGMLDETKARAVLEYLRKMDNQGVL